MDTRWTTTESFPECLRVDELIEVRQWWKDLLGWDTDGRLDFVESEKKFPKHHTDAVKVLAAHYPHKLAWIPETDSWYFWAGHVWEMTFQTDMIFQMMDVYAQTLERALAYLKSNVYENANLQTYREALATGQSENDAVTAGKKAAKEALGKWTASWKTQVKMVEGMRAAGGMMTLMRFIRSTPGFVASLEDFDSWETRAWWVTKNEYLDLGGAADELRQSGVWNLAGHTYAARPDLHLTQHSSCIWDRTVDWRGSEWEQFLEGVLPEEDARLHIRNTVGSMMLGDPKEKILLNFIGPKDTGKSVTLNLLGGVFGDYGTAISADVLLEHKNSSGGPSPELHSLRLAKFIAASEPDGRKDFHGAAVKMITGGDLIASRTLFQKTVSQWRMRGIVALASNDIVKFDASDTALAQRLHPVTFNQVFLRPREVLVERPGMKFVDVGLQDRILENDRERSAIFAWMLCGLEDYLRNGVQEPKAMVVARGEMAQASSTALVFLMEKLADGSVLLDPPGMVKRYAVDAGAFYEAYVAWCDTEGVAHPVSRTRFVKELRPRADSCVGLKLGGRTKDITLGPGAGAGRKTTFDRLIQWDWYDYYITKGLSGG